MNTGENVKWVFIVCVSKEFFIRRLGFWFGALSPVNYALYLNLCLHLTWEMKFLARLLYAISRVSWGYSELVLPRTSLFWLVLIDWSSLCSLLYLYISSSSCLETTPSTWKMLTGHTSWTFASFVRFDQITWRLLWSSVTWHWGTHNPLCKVWQYIELLFDL